VLAEIAVEQRACPAQILIEQAAIEPELAAQLRHVLVGGAEAEHGAHGVARDQPDDEEDDNTHHEQHGDREEQAPQDEDRQRAHLCAPARSSSCPARWTSSRMRSSDSVKCRAAMSAATS